MAKKRRRKIAGIAEIGSKIVAMPGFPSFSFQALRLRSLRTDVCVWTVQGLGFAREARFFDLPIPALSAMSAIPAISMLIWGFLPRFA